MFYAKLSIYILHKAIKLTPDAPEKVWDELAAEGYLPAGIHPAPARFVSDGDVWYGRVAKSVFFLQGVRLSGSHIKVKLAFQPEGPESPILWLARNLFLGLRSLPQGVFLCERPGKVVILVTGLEEVEED